MAPATIPQQITLPPITILKCLLQWIPFLLISPLIFLLLSVLLTYKWIVLLLWKLLKRQDLVSPVTGLDVMFSTDDFHNRPLGSLGFVWFLEGPISSKIIEKRLAAALSSSSSSSSSSSFPPNGSNNSSGINGYEKLTSVYPTFWLGFPFWRKLRSKFSLTDHVKIMRPSFRSHRSPTQFMDDVNRLICGWMEEPFPQGRPLWEIRIVEEIAFSEDSDLSPRKQPGKDASPGDPSKIHDITAANTHQDGDPPKSRDSRENGKVKSILVLKTHHMLGDGNSMLRFLDKIIDPPVRPPPSPKAEFHFHPPPNKVGNGMGENLESQDGNVQVIKKDQQGEDASTLSGKSPNLTTTYSCNNASGAIKPGELFPARRGFPCFWRLWQWLKDSLGCWWHHLSSAIYFTLFIPTSVFALVHSCVLHRDSWFTQKKVSDKVNMATCSMSMSRLNEIRRELCTPTPTPPPFNYENGNGNECEEIKEKRIGPSSSSSSSSSVPIVVMAVAALSGALSKLISRKVGMNGGTRTSRSSSSTSTRSFVNFIIALPLRKAHPGKIKFCNFWTHGILQTSFLEWDDGHHHHEGLHRVNSNYWEMRGEQRPEIYHKLQKIYGLFPRLILSSISNYNLGAAIGVTNMRGADQPVFIGGHQVRKKLAYFGLQWRHASLTLALLSYNGEMTASILANESVIRKEDMELLSQFWLREMEAFGGNRRTGANNPNPTFSRSGELKEPSRGRSESQK